MDEEKKLDTLLSLYNNVLTDIAFYQNQGDSTNVKDVIPIAIIPLLDFFGVNTFIISIICLFAPVIQCLSLQRGIQAHRFVAMLRGYAASIEESINKLLGENHFLYNSVLIDKYIASDRVVKNRGTKNSWFITVLMHCAVWGICVGFFIHFNIGQPWWVFVLSSMWLLFLLIYILMLCKKLSEKEKIRFESKDLVKTMLKEK